ncbi:unnamed protein product [Nippostrongylus brasiliensis]|uniref:Glutamine amidotransferase type-1 domain-containing protein n=1 Tax=Nippostrongylus brasiliensis TaxID=27835 RepID=A0A0N4XEF4_NIPBR|nr:unnamed protein product [Nippostrongylus brasiliensis]
MIKVCQYARENNVPFLGVCLGMQCAAIEVARNLLGITNANSTEFNKQLTEDEQVIIDMPEHNVEHRGLGGTMRLGRRTSVFLTDSCKLRQLYGKDEIEERHRHRYEVNPRIVPELSKKGLLFVGMGVDETSCTSLTKHARTQSSAALMKMAVDHTVEEDLLSKITDLCHRGGDGVTRPALRMEMCEMKDHPYFVGAQFHPEYLSHPLQPSPPFLGLLLAATGQLKDYRFMAVNDLMRELQTNNMRLDDDSEKKVVRMLIRLLDDNSGEVQNLAVKCLGTVTQRVKEAQQTKPNDSVRLEVVDIAGDVLTRFGALIPSVHKETQKVLLDQLLLERPALKKKATIALGAMMAVCSQELFKETMDVFVERLTDAKGTHSIRTYVVALTFVAKSNGSHGDTDEDEAEDYSDDDDMSWKVRRASAKTIEAMIVSRRDQLSNSVQSLGPLLISRLREREENVRIDIYNAYIAILSQARLVVPNSLAALHKDKAEEPVKIGCTLFSPSALSAEQQQLLEAIAAQSEPLLKAVMKQIKMKSPRTRSLSFELLASFVRTLPGSLASYLPSLLPGLMTAVLDRASGAPMKIDALTLLARVIKCHDSKVFALHLENVVQLTIGAIQDSFYKVSAEGLSVASLLVPVIRDCNGGHLVPMLYSAIFEKLKINDIDQEVKERAIYAAGLFVATFADDMPDMICFTLFIF